MSESYVIEHVADLAYLADGDIDAFCSELPSMIRDMKTFFQAVESASPGGMDRRKVMPRVSWQNDGEDRRTVNFTCGGESIGVLDFKPGFT